MEKFKWDDSEDIGIALSENHPGVDPLKVRFTDLHQWVIDLEEFEEAATLIASIEVRPPETLSAATAVDQAGEVPVDPRPEQGFPVVLAETLTAAILVSVDPWEDERDDEEEDDDETPQRRIDRSPSAIR